MVHASGSAPYCAAAARHSSGDFFSSPRSWAKVTPSKYPIRSRRVRAVRQCSGTLEVTTAIRLPSARHCSR